MGYYLSEPAPSNGDPTAKNRVWGFFGESVSVNLETRRAALETHRENYGESRETASGIPLWPSRDPIGELGGVNLYGFVFNSPTVWVDYLGLDCNDPAAKLLDAMFPGLPASKPKSSPWRIECERCEKENGGFKMDCYLTKASPFKGGGEKREHSFEANDYDDYSPGQKGNSLPNDEGLDGARLPEGDYTVDNDRSGNFGPNTPTISNNGVPGEVEIPGGPTKTNNRIHPQKNRSDGCVTIPDTDHSIPQGNEDQDDLRSPHVNLIRELIRKSGPMRMTIKDVGPCDPETCVSDYEYPQTR